MVKRGEIYLANLQPRSGPEQSGRRPVIIVSHDGFNRTDTWRSLIVIPISSSSNHRGPTVVVLPRGSGGLDRDSVALCHQVTTLDRGKLERLVGNLTSHLLDEIAQSLRSALAI